MPESQDGTMSGKEPDALTYVLTPYLPYYINILTPLIDMKIIIAAALTLFGIALIIAAFVVPPTGIIDPTVLTAYGETLTFAGALFGIDCHYRGNNNNIKDNEEK